VQAADDGDRGKLSIGHLLVVLEQEEFLNNGGNYTPTRPDGQALLGPVLVPEGFLTRDMCNTLGHPRLVEGLVS
jgi:hypothetical protein